MKRQLITTAIVIIVVTLSCCMLGAAECANIHELSSILTIAIVGYMCLICIIYKCEEGKTSTYEFILGAILFMLVVLVAVARLQWIDSVNTKKLNGCKENITNLESFIEDRGYSLFDVADYLDNRDICNE